MILHLQVLGLPNVLGGSSTWPWLISLTVLPPLIQLVLLPFCPSSPRYLAISLDSPDEAREALLLLRANNVSQVDAEMEEMLAEKEASKEPDMGVFKLLGSSSLRPALIICVVMHLSQQLSGMVSTLFFFILRCVRQGVPKRIFVGEYQCHQKTFREIE